MDVTDQDIRNLRRISEQVFGDKAYIEIDEVKDTKGDVMVRVTSLDGGPDTRNAFAGDNLRTFTDGGYVAIAVGGDTETHTAWFERADALEFGEPGPSGEYDLRDDWSARVGDDNLILRKGGDTVANLGRDGWTLPDHIMYKVLPSSVAQDLYDHGFERGDVDC